METINTVWINIKKNRQQLKKFSSNQSKENIKTELNKNVLNASINVFGWEKPKLYLFSMVPLP